MQNKALFLDRDGVVNFDYGYVHLEEDFDFINGIFDLTKLASDKGYKIVIVTNQSGIGRGYYSEDRFLELSQWMCNCFKKEGVQIKKVYYCASHPTDAFGVHKKIDVRRKPGPGMFFDACNELNINLKKSILIGDKVSDVQAGHTAGVGVRLLLNSKKQKTSYSDDLCTEILSLNEAQIYL